MNPCKHKFEPRYDRRWSTAMSDMASLVKYSLKIESFCNDKYLKEEIYVYDICVKCGITVKREQT